MARLTGECLCGAIAYAIDGPIGNVVHCHCSRCRRWHGAAFRSRVVVRTADFAWRRGEEHLSCYSSTPKVTKTFCKICGSSLVTIYPTRPGLMAVPIAGTEGELGTYDEFHIFVGSKAKWFEINDRCRQYDELPDDPGAIHAINESRGAAAAKDE